jgi:predicted methyltransferase
LINFEDVHFLVRCLRYRFRTEKLPLKTLMRLDLKGAAVIDVGANKGIYCFWLSRAVGQSGKVIAFEPQPEKSVTSRAESGVSHSTTSRRSKPPCPIIAAPRN